jgi:hypothetical protein
MAKKTTTQHAQAIHNADQENAKAHESRGESLDGLLPSERAMKRSAALRSNPPIGRADQALAIAETAADAIGRSPLERGTAKLADAIAKPDVIGDLVREKIVAEAAMEWFYGKIDDRELESRIRNA